MIKKCAWNTEMGIWDYTNILHGRLVQTFQLFFVITYFEYEAFKGNISTVTFFQTDMKIVVG